MLVPALVLEAPKPATHAYSATPMIRLPEADIVAVTLSLVLVAAVAVPVIPHCQYDAPASNKQTLVDLPSNTRF